MKTNVLSYLLLSLFIPAVSLAGDDLQSWNAVSVEKKLDKQWRLTWNPLWRFREDVSESFYWGSRQGIGYKAHQNLDLAVQYLYLEEETALGAWNTEHRLELQPTFKWKWLDLDWSNRHRFEYRDVVSGGKWRYRNMTKLSKKMSIDGFEFAPYVSDEVFYDPKRSEWAQNRLSIGIAKKLSETVSLDLYYLLRSDRTGKDFNESHVLGTSINFSF